MSIKAVLFDLDGVLVDTRHLHYLALSTALESFGYSLSLEEHQLHYDGLPTLRKLEMLKDRFQLTKKRITEIEERKQEQTRILLGSTLKPNPEHVEIFKFLSEINVPTAICSNSKRKTLDFVIERLNLGNSLKFSLSNEDVIKPKPSPEIYNKAIKKMGLHPSQVIIFEDSPFGIQAAVSSGARVIEIGSPDELKLHLLKEIFLQAKIAS